MARHLLGGAPDDIGVLAALQALLARPPDARLLSLSKCTGCVLCGHEGGRKGRIQAHGPRNPCPCCPASADGRCRPTASGACTCAFHALERQRRVERIADRVRRDPAFLQVGGCWGARGGCRRC